MYRLRLGLSLLAFLHFLRASGQATASTDSIWSFSVSGYYYFIPEDQNTITLIGYADYKKLHLEARYNYEDRETGSVFAGRHFAHEGKMQWTLTPMMGVAFGNKNGAIPALELEATFKKFNFYSETEYVFDFSGKENNFLYTWSEIAYAPIEVLKAGISFQRTLLYQADLEVQRGLMVKYFPGKLTIGAYYFSPFSKDHLFIFMLSLDF